jgi:alpha-D-ribose 1-methylphosphonate 5-triphosphate synthase subunit PhnG
MTSSVEAPPAVPGEPTPAPVALRRAWLAVLARAGTEELESGLSRNAPGLRYEFLRRPERGMVMLRGRVGGTGDSFNLGEATVTRCTVRLADGGVGSGHVLGRDRRKAELVAVFDALLQEPAYRAALEREVVAGLRQQQQARRAEQAAATGASKVEFFTMVRGE